MKSNLENENGTPIKACKQIKGCANNVLDANNKKLSFYVNAKGKGIITNPSILKGLDPLYAAISEVLLKKGVLVLEGNYE